MRRVLNHGNHKRIMVPKVPALLEALAEPLDLLNVVDAELLASLLFEDQRHEDGPVGVGVDAAAGIALGEGGEEEGGALAGLVNRWAAEVDSLAAGEGLRLGGEREDVDVGGLHELLLNTRRGEVD